MAFSDNLQYLRKRDKVTQEELADRLGVSRQSVSKWETGEAYPETEKILALCDNFGISMDQLMRGDVSDPSAEGAGCGNGQEASVPSPTCNPAAIACLAPMVIESMTTLELYAQSSFILVTELGRYTFGSAGEYVTTTAPPLLFISSMHSSERTDPCSIVSTPPRAAISAPVPL